MVILRRTLFGVACLLLIPSGGRAAVQDCPAADAIVSATSASAAPDQREAAYLRALAACPQHPGVLNNLGDTYEQIGRFDEAIAHYDRAAEAYRAANAAATLQALPLFGIGDVYRKLRRDDDALYWYRTGLELDPTNAETLAAVAELARNDPPNLVGSRGIGAMLRGDRSAGVMAVLALDQRALPFAYNRADLLPEAHAQLREIAFAIRDLLGAPRSLGVLAAGPPVAEIGGHADRRGTDEYNRDLARRRAEAVVAALVERFAIPRSRLTAASYGEARTMCDDDTEACHARNRRVEIKRP